MIAHHEREMKELGDVMYAMELRYTQREAEAKQEFQSLMDDLKNKVCWCSVSMKLKVPNAVTLLLHSKC